MESIDAFVEKDEIHAAHLQHFCGQCAGVGTDDAHGELRMALPELGGKFGDANHASRAGIRVLAINHETDQARIGLHDTATTACSSLNRSAPQSRMATPKPFARQLCANRSAHVGGSIAEKSSLNS